MDTVRALEKKGYRIISRKYRHAARIDSKDWREFMTKGNMPESEDLFRRVYSKDVIIVSRGIAKKMKGSVNGDIGYVETPTNKGL